MLRTSNRTLRDHLTVVEMERALFTSEVVVVCKEDDVKFSIWYKICRRDLKMITIEATQGAVPAQTEVPMGTRAAETFI